MKRFVPLALCAAVACAAHAAVLIVGQTNGTGMVSVNNATTGALVTSFQAFEPTFMGGLFVAAGDVNGDGTDDLVVSAGPGGGPHVRVFDGKTYNQIVDFVPYSASFTGGVRVASGDIDGDGFDDIITGPGPGGTPNVKVFSGANGGLISSFFAFASTYTGGVFVAAKDGTSRATSRIYAGSSNLLAIFDGNASPLTSFFPYGNTFTGGVRIAVGDVNGDGKFDTVTGVADSAPPLQKVFDGVTNANIYSYIPGFPPSYAGGLSVAAGDITGDGKADLFGASYKSDNTVCIFNGSNLSVINFYQVFPGGYANGIDIALGTALNAFPLYIESVNPAGGVPMTVYTADQRGLKNGNTRMSRLYTPGTNVNVTAPKSVGGQYFDHWELDGADWGIARTIATPMNAPHTIRAFYLAGRTITFQSQNPSGGVPIELYQTDQNGERNGTTQFSRVFTQGTTVSFTAPALFGTNYFLRWDLAGSPWTSNKTASLMMGGTNRAVTAVYATGYLLNVYATTVATPITVWNPDKAGRKDGVTPLTRIYGQGSSVSLTAPATFGGKTFDHWDADGSPVPGNKKTVTITMGSDHTMTAIYVP